MVSKIVQVKVGNNLVEIGKFLLSDKSMVVKYYYCCGFFFSIWKLGNGFSFQKVGWKSMEMLLHRIAGLPQN